MVCCNQEFMSATCQSLMERKGGNRGTRTVKPCSYDIPLTLVAGSHTLHSTGPPGSSVTTVPFWRFSPFLVYASLFSPSRSFSHSFWFYAFLSFTAPLWPEPYHCQSPWRWADRHPTHLLRQTERWGRGGGGRKTRERKDCVSVSSLSLPLRKMKILQFQKKRRFCFGVEEETLLVANGPRKKHKGKLEKGLSLLKNFDPPLLSSNSCGHFPKGGGALFEAVTFSNVCVHECVCMSLCHCQNGLGPCYQDSVWKGKPQTENYGPTPPLWGWLRVRNAEEGWTLWLWGWRGGQECTDILIFQAFSGWGCFRRPACMSLTLFQDLNAGYLQTALLIGFPRLRNVVQAALLNLQRYSEIQRFNTYNNTFVLDLYLLKISIYESRPSHWHENKAVCGCVMILCNKMCS